MTSLQSHLLIATNDLAEPFARSVVLLVRHDADGALGLILNRRTSADLKDAWDKLSDVPCRREGSLYLGGPCEGPLMSLHTYEFLLDIEVMPGLYFSTSKDRLESLAAQADDESARAKFFAGYSGWSPGQLEHEIAGGSWSVMPANHDHVFGAEDELWLRCGRFVADAAWRGALGIKQAPSDLRLN